jgi:hypothetical protein
MPTVWEIIKAHPVLFWMFLGAWSILGLFNYNSFHNRNAKTIEGLSQGRIPTQAGHVGQLLMVIMVSGPLLWLTFLLAAIHKALRGK